MKADSHLWQRYPATARLVTVALLAVPAIVAAAVLAHNDCDPWIIVAVGNDGKYRKFVEAGGRAELADDERFATNPARVRNRDTLVPLLVEMVRTRSKAEWIAALEASQRFALRSIKQDDARWVLSCKLRNAVARERSDRRIFEEDHERHCRGAGLGAPFAHPLVQLIDQPG